LTHAELFNKKVLMLHTFLYKKNGLVDLKQFEDAIRPDTVMASVMFVNNEIGVIQPIEELGAICKKKGILFHTDAAQATGKVKIDVNSMKIDLMSLSGHKMYGPKGIGAVYVRRKAPRVRIDPIQSGGGQERNIRSGTLPTALIVGMGVAADVCFNEMDRDAARVKKLWDKLYLGIKEKIPEIYVNGDLKFRYYGNLNISFAYVEGESLLMALKEVACSSGSACTSASLEPSYVLRAIGVNDDMAHTSIRFGVGRFTTENEIDHAIQLCIKHVNRLRDLSPLWEMVQEGVDISKIQWTQDH